MPPFAGLEGRRIACDALLLGTFVDSGPSKRVRWPNSDGLPPTSAVDRRSQITSSSFRPPRLGVDSCAGIRKSWSGPKKGSKKCIMTSAIGINTPMILRWTARPRHKRPSRRQPTKSFVSLQISIVNQAAFLYVWRTRIARPEQAPLWEWKALTRP